MSTFLKTICPRCKHQQVIYSRPATIVKCNQCNHLLARNSGGKGRMHAKVKKVLKS